MHVALIISGSLVGVGALLYLHHRLTYRPDTEVDEPTDKESDEQTPSICCGLHIVCEKDSVSPVFAEGIEYFDDEELDRYTDRNDNEYTTQEIEIFRDILLTLRPEDIAPWARSVQQRGITLPSEIRDELLLIVEEARSA